LSKNSAPFWERKTLSDMTKKEWESLCDGCALCCQVRLEDPDTGEIALTNVACRCLDLCSLTCKNYETRHKIVPDCISLTPENVGTLTWLPETCAYRLIHYGNPLPSWHPLLSGNPESIHTAGISMKGDLVSEDEIEDWEAEFGDEEE